MNLLLDSIIDTPAFTIATAPDGTRIALSGERKITVFSFPDLKIIESFQAKHTCSMVYLSDSKSILIQNTAGNILVWNGVSVESVGKWPTSGWQERPMFYSNKDCVLLAGLGGIWMYETLGRRISNIYSTDNDIRICRCDQKSIKCVALPCDGTEKKAEILCLDYEGTVLRQAQSEDAVMNSLFSPAWSDSNTIAISTPAAQGFPLNLVYLFDLEGRTISQEWIPAAEDNGDFCYGMGLFAKVSTVGEYAVTLWDAHNMKLVYKMDKENLAAYGITTPPTFAYFSSDKRILLGSWDKLFVFRIV